VKALQAGPAVLDDEPVQQGGDRIDRCRTGRARPDGVRQLVPELVLVGEGKILLRPEVGEQRLDRDAGRVGDLGHGDVVVPAGLEQPGRRGEDRGPGLPLLPLPQPARRFIV
jgi:hypothetical protein